MADDHPSNDGSLSDVILDGSESIQDDKLIEKNIKIDGIKKAMGKDYVIKQRLCTKWRHIKTTIDGTENKSNELLPILEIKKDETFEKSNPKLSTVKEKGTYKIHDKRINFSVSGKLKKVMNIVNLTETELHLSYMNKRSQGFVTVEKQYRRVE